MNPTNQNDDIITVNGGVIYEKDLPLPYVKYPSGNVPVLLFSSSKSGRFYICSCFKRSIKNYWYWTKKEHNRVNNESWDERYKKGFLGNLYMKYYKLDIEFKQNICHECNGGLTPKPRYCHPMYGSTFQQKYGWYILKYTYLLIRCPKREMDEDVLDLRNKLDELEKKRESIISNPNLEFDRKNSVWKEKNFTEKRIRKLSRVLGKIPENECRKVFGYKPIGQQWVNETLIYKMCIELFPNYTVKHHYRPDFLKGLELDIFIDDFKVGIEYQGKQHFEPIDFFGGEESLKGVQKRDKKKKELCEQHGVKLVYINYDEVVSKKLIENKLKILE